jgi:hypothetical protein
MWKSSCIPPFYPGPATMITRDRTTAPVLFSFRPECRGERRPAAHGEGHRGPLGDVGQTVALFVRKVGWHGHRALDRADV